MSLNDVYRDRHYAPGYVYIAGSLSGRVIKIGTTVNIGRPQQNKLRNLKYGGLDDWVLLYYVWVDEGGNIEHAARRKLQPYKTMRMYYKDGSRQKAREILQCSFSMAQKTLSNLISEEERSRAWQSSYCSVYDF
jgi:hypothetical protein